MARVEITCSRCGARHVGGSVAEAQAWDREHDDYCIALHPDNTPTGYVLTGDGRIEDAT